MAWSTSTRRQRLPRSWPAIRRRILRRDGYKCTWIRVDTEQRCNAAANQVDHIDEQGPDEDWNLRALCFFHHQRRSSQQGGRASAAKRKQDDLIHPGYTGGTAGD